MNDIPEKISAQLEKNPIDWQNVLEETISHFDCSTGTLHFLKPGTSILELQAQKGIPDFLMPKVSGEMCNVQTDASGVARPAAKETKVEGSLAAPLIHQGKLYGTIGIAKPVSYDFTEEEISSLMEIGNLICQKIN